MANITPLSNQTIEIRSHAMYHRQGFAFAEGVNADGSNNERYFLWALPNVSGRSDMIAKDLTWDELCALISRLADPYR